MTVLSVYDEEFREYGKVLGGYDAEELSAAMSDIRMPLSGTSYEPSIPSLEACGIFNDLRDRAYGGMPIQIGLCWGFNTKLNCLEYHRCSEINIGLHDFVLLLAKECQIQGGKLDTGLVRAFKAPAGVPVEVFATSLHYAPCMVSSAGFKVAIVLPKGTNTERPSFRASSEEDRWMTACNKWLLAHPESAEAKGGAYVGLVGKNIDIVGIPEGGC